MPRASSNHRSFSLVGKLWLIPLLSIGTFVLLLLPAIFRRDDNFRSDRLSDLQKVVMKYFPNHSGNWTTTQILNSLDMELDRLEFEGTRLHSDIQRQKSLPKIWRTPTMPLSPSSSAFVPTIQKLRKSFLDMFGMATGAAIQLNSTTDDAPKLTPYEFQERRKHVDNIHRLLKKELEQLTAPFNHWREFHAKVLADYIHQRFQDIQNLATCDPTEILICDAFSSTRLETILHELIACSTASITLNRTIVFPSYDSPVPPPTFDWSNYIVSPSPKCQRSQQKTHLLQEPRYETTFYSRTGSEQSAEQPMPRNYKDFISQFHPDPDAWWTGQMLENIWRLRPRLQEEFKDKHDVIGFRPDVVGVHIQRPSHGRLSKDDSELLADYMAVIAEHYQRLDPSTDLDQRKLYVVSDIPVVYAELRLRYPQYTVLSSQNVLPRLTGRHTAKDETMLKSIADMWFLEKTSHLVCSATSKICRMAHAIIQTKAFDAQSRLDLGGL
ncbi:hypothetical protein RvY_00856 [Ramazzottius varieornatus]|uniref:GT23 domain-containing protein n=1 Tax=Ramazzottius varieornatus TaxID=947166 RepID=A0A1D1UHW7_RAMVA|nr:hypothetical protein RvY_00856 [Ramazzottius varieornatus]